MGVLTSNRLFLPICTITGSDFLINVIILMFIGQLGALEMAAVTLASSFCNVTGFSVLSGLLTAYDTLASQAYGANKPKNIGIATNQSLLGCGIVSVLILPVWMVRSTKPSG